MTAEVRVVMDLPEETTKPHRPRYRLHLLTWLVAIINLAAVTNLQRHGWYDQTYSTAGVSSTHGWPLLHVHVYETRPGNLRTRTWYFDMLVANLLVWSVLLSSTMFVCERWQRQQKRLQFSLAKLLLLGFTVAVLTQLVKLDPTIYDNVVTPFGWPILLAAGCVCLSLLDLQRAKRELFVWGSSSITETSYDVGWPLPHRVLTHIQPWNTYTYDWYLRMLVANLATWLMLVASAMIVCERWSQSGARSRFQANAVSARLRGRRARAVERHLSRRLAGVPPSPALAGRLRGWLCSVFSRVVRVEMGHPGGVPSLAKV
jgi:hypothetical protein